MKAHSDSGLSPGPGRLPAAPVCLAAIQAAAQQTSLGEPATLLMIKLGYSNNVNKEPTYQLDKLSVE